MLSHQSRSCSGQFDPAPRLSSPLKESTVIVRNTKLIRQKQMSMVTFHPFPRLPLEIRIQIWKSAIETSRVLKIRKLKRRSLFKPYSPAYWSPTNTPSVIRVCRESRKNSGYQKAFIVEGSPRYFWVNFENDVLQIQSDLMNN